MVRPDSSDLRRVIDEPPPSDATQSKQRIIQPPLLQHSRISLDGPDYAAGQEFERMLDHVLEQVRLATSATAAAIALKSGDEMVCRAAAGPNAPDVGVRLDVSSGLSGACVRTREVQYCADAESDPRVNAAASRRLQVRSVLVVPLQSGEELLGVFEIFSPHAGAFGNRDLQNLQTLSKVIIENLRGQPAEPQPAEAASVLSVAEPTPLPEPQVQAVVAQPSPILAEESVMEDEPLFAWPVQRPDKPDKKEEEHDAGPATTPEPSVLLHDSAAPVEVPVFTSVFPEKASRQKRTRDWSTSLLTAAVITVAVVLGWTVGRPGWRRATGGEKRTSTTPPTPADSVDARSGSSSARNDGEAVEPSSETIPPGHTAAPKPDDSTGGLVVYQNGKVIFRQNARSWPSGRPSAELKTSPGGDPPERAATVFLSPLMASARLLQRIEPVYPETALQTHIQGEVELEALVGKDGAVQQLKLLSGDPQLAVAAADAIRQWRFRPYQSDGQIVEFSTRLSIDFRLP